MSSAHVRQTEAAECGLACLAIICARLGADVGLSEIRSRYPASSRGMTARDIIEVANGLDLTARAVRCEIEELSQLAVPAILHWKMNHFVVLLCVRRRSVVVQDPAGGVRRMAFSEVNKLFTGVAIEVAKSPRFKKRKERSPLNLASLITWSPATWAGLAQILILSVLIQVYVVASPFYLRLAIDEAALKGDLSLLALLATGFAMFAVFNAGAAALRALALQKQSALLGWDMTRRIFHHMLSLPLQWFQRRRLADTMTRFESVEPIRNLVANGLVGSIIDGVLSVVTLIMMFIFAWPLAVISIAGFAIYLALRLALLPILLRFSAEALAASIAEQGKRIENLRAIQTIKVMGAEGEKEADWANRYAEMIRSVQRTAILGITTSCAQTLLDSLVMIATIYFGVISIIDGQLTIGGLYAFMAYRTQFAGRAQNLLDQFIAWRLMDIHSERLADIALTAPEPGLDVAGLSSRPMAGQITLRGLAFRYSPQDRLVFSGLNAVIRQGEFVALVGPSGVGKSTLLKLIAGLYPASAGEVVIDGLSLQSWGPRAVRRNLGVVMQDDELLAGTIADNVTFFAEEADPKRIWECLRLAAMDGDVEEMPMGLETFVGDMGSALSGGQKQRVLLARALYKNPKVLLLDEATSHLDLEREMSINAALRALKMTRIIIAHRPETVAAAERILLVTPGGLMEVTQRSGATTDALSHGRKP